MNKYIELGTPMLKNTGEWNHRLLVGTAVTGLIRAEWVQARYGQTIPTNWSLVEAMQYINSSMPLHFQVSDAQNLIVKTAIEVNAEWVWLLEQDNVLPQGAFIKMNTYMREKKVPVISGLYFTKSVPPEPLIYRESGRSYYMDWKIGDMVWCSGVPTGCLLIHASILRSMWDESPEYRVGDYVTRKVFKEPAQIIFDPQRNSWISETGTSDLHWCKRVMTDGFFEKAGWPKYQKMKYPFLVDTSLFTRHIDNNGRQFPLDIPKEYLPESKSKSNYRKKYYDTRDI